MQSSQSMYNLSSTPTSQYVPSHLRQSQQNHQVPKSSPAHMRRSSTVGRFGGPSFGTPKASRSSRSHEASLEDAPPISSIYDYNGGSTFAPAADLSQNPAGFSAANQKSASTLASPPLTVIVFGFPPDLTSKVLEHFSRYGQVETHTSPDTQSTSNGNNWLKITYERTMAAQRAVAANGSFIAGQYMIGCVYAQTDPLFSSEQDADDAMDIDPQTPEKSRAVQPSPSNHVARAELAQTPIRDQTRSNNVPMSTPGGRKIEILNSEAIYKSNSPISERAAQWMPSWLSAAEEKKLSGTPTPNGADTQSTEKQTAGWTSRLLRGLVDTIFGF